MRILTCTFCLLLLTVVSGETMAGSVDNWGQWRGPDATGASPGGTPPIAWSEEENVRWKVEIPGSGSSSPIVWGDFVFIQTAVDTGVVVEAAPEPEPEQATETRPARRRGRGSSKPKTLHRFMLMCIDRNDGKTVWERCVREEVPHEATHRTGTYSNTSPVTDGEHVFAYFGSRGLYCLDMKGDVVWEKNLGQMKTRNQFGEGSSPALYGDSLIVNWDHQGDSFMVAFDKRTGNERWQVPRDEHTTWATPTIVEVDGKHQVIVTGVKFSRGYDLATGEPIWKCSGMTDNPIPTPICQDGIVYLASGFRGSALQAIRLAGAKGDITGTEAVVWTHNKGTPYVPTPLLYGHTLYFMASNGNQLSCFNVQKGTANYEPQRLEAIKGVYASPVGANGCVYVAGREGATVVLKHDPAFEILATNRLDDGFDASPAIVGDALYLRGKKFLYCIAEGGER